MKHKDKRNLALVMAVVLGASMAIGGCGKKAETSQTTGKEQAANAAAVSQTADEGAAGEEKTAGNSGQSAPAGSSSETKRITVLQTSDIHGFLNAHDYSSDIPSGNGLSKIAALIKEERKSDPDAILIDTGDASQGNMIERFRKDEVPGSALGFNLLDYDAYILGNHDFNFEFDSLCHTIDAMDAEVLSANIYKTDGSRFVQPYLIKEVDGVRVAVIGFTTPQVPSWESANPAHFDGMSFTDPVEELGKVLDEVEPKADVIIAAAHDGRKAEQESPGFYKAAETYGDRIDAIFTGHEHAEYVEDHNGVLMAGSGSQGKFLMKAVFELAQTDDGWTVTGRNAELLSTQETEPDPDFVKATAYIHDDCVAKANAVIGTIAADFQESTDILPGIPRISHEDTAVMDLINTVQLQYSGAGVSMTNGFDPYVSLNAGPFLYKDAMKLYPFDNSVKVLFVTGAELKAIMEQWAGAYFNQWKPGDVTVSADPGGRFIGYDMFTGVNYEIDVSQPAGQRIRNVTYQDAPLKDDAQLTLAVNSFRLAIMEQSGQSYDVIYDSFNSSGPSTVRDMLTDYIEKSGTVSPNCDHNWKLTGADLEDPQKELIYGMIRKGEIVIEQSEDGRNPNLSAVNADELRQAGVIPSK